MRHSERRYSYQEMIENFMALKVPEALRARPSGNGTQEVAKCERQWSGCLCSTGDTLSTYDVDAKLP